VKKSGPFLNVSRDVVFAMLRALVIEEAKRSPFGLVERDEGPNAEWLSDRSRRQRRAPAAAERQGTAEIDISDVRIIPVRLGGSDLEAEVTTRYGVARVTLDLTSDDAVEARAVLPSGNVYERVVDSWDGDAGEHETLEGISSTLRVAAGFIIQCFQKEATRVN
jgi:hypothetical protein